MYNALEAHDSLDLVENSDDCACAIFLLTGLKELKGEIETIATAFDANPAKVRVLLSTAISARYENTQKTNEENANEADRF